MSRSSHVLPFELVDMVISNVTAEYAPASTLRSCALVCKIWHAVARTFIFRFVTLSSKLALTKLGKILERNPDLGFSIRRIALVQHTWSKGCILTHFYKQSHLSSSSLPRLVEVEIVEVQFKNSDITVAITKFAEYRSVKSLEVNGCCFSTIRSMFSLLHGFPEISSFSCYPEIPSNDLDSSAAVPSGFEVFPLLRTFKFLSWRTSCSHRDILKVFGTLPYKSTVSEYGFSLSPFEAPNLVAFLLGVKNLVTALDFSYCPGSIGHFNGLPLPALPNLHKLSVGPSTMFTIPLSSDALYEIEFGIGIKHINIDELRISCIKRITGADLPNLRSFRFITWVRQLPSLMEQLREDEWAQKKCAGFVERGIEVSHAYSVRPPIMDT